MPRILHHQDSDFVMDQHSSEDQFTEELPSQAFTSIDRALGEDEDQFTEELPSQVFAAEDEDQFTEELPSQVFAAVDRALAEDGDPFHVILNAQDFEDETLVQEVVPESINITLDAPQTGGNRGEECLDSTDVNLGEPSNGSK